MTQWQDISTAPEDDTRILVTDGETVVIGIRKLFPREGGRYETFRDEDVIPGHSWSIHNCTHWMPLPTPPAPSIPSHMEKGE